MPTIEQHNNKRIAKNALLLYVRLFITMAIGLYTSRVILQNLGVEDFGIYNVVGGVVTMLSILTGSLSTAISRFLTFELGKNDREKLSKVFSSAVTIQLLLVVIVVFIAESVGIWFLNNKMNIPPERLFAANWVFQMSIVSFGVNLISVPYSAAIIAHERMSAFAYISVVEALGKLTIAWIIAFSHFDRLIFYSILMSCMALGIRLIYGWYCKRQFKECTYRFVFDKALLKQMFGFAGWNFIGASSAVLRDHGSSIVLNLFFGPVVNAARGVAVQVQHAVSQFQMNFMTALNPQITKSYANDNRKYMMSLIFQGARLSFYMLLVLSLPIFFNVDFILSVWLKTVPEHSAQFVQLVLVFVMGESISTPLITAMLATGKIRNYQIIVGGLQMLNLPVIYVLLRMGFAPESAFFTTIVISQCALFARLIMLKKMISLKVGRFLRQVYLNVIIVSFLSALLPWGMKYFLLDQMDAVSFVLSCLVCLLSATIVVLWIGCSREERLFVRNKMALLINRVKHV